jgi:hypothetical protein
MGKSGLSNGREAPHSKIPEAVQPILVIEWLSWLLLFALSVILLAQFLNAMRFWGGPIFSLQVVERTMLWMTFACLLTAFVSIYRGKSGRLMLCLATVFSLLFFLGVAYRAWTDFQTYFFRNPSFFGLFLPLRDSLYSAIGLITLGSSIVFLSMKVVEENDETTVENAK